MRFLHLAAVQFIALAVYTTASPALLADSASSSMEEVAGRELDYSLGEENMEMRDWLDVLDYDFSGFEARDFELPFVEDLLERGELEDELIEREDFLDGLEDASEARDLELAYDDFVDRREVLDALEDELEIRANGRGRAAMAHKVVNNAMGAYQFYKSWRAKKGNAVPRGQRRNSSRGRRAH